MSIGVRYRFGLGNFAVQFREFASRSFVKGPSLGAILLALIPFIATCFSVAIWDRIYPRVFGLPFNFFWLILWLLLTPLIMWGAYRLEEPSARNDRQPPDGTH